MPGRVEVQNVERLLAEARRNHAAWVTNAEFARSSQFHRPDGKSTAGAGSELRDGRLNGLTNARVGRHWRRGLCDRGAPYRCSRTAAAAHMLGAVGIHRRDRATRKAVRPDIVGVVPSREAGAAGHRGRWAMGLPPCTCVSSDGGPPSPYVHCVVMVRCGSWAVPSWAHAPAMRSSHPSA